MGACTRLAFLRLDPGRIRRLGNTDPRRSSGGTNSNGKNEPRRTCGPGTRLARIRNAIFFDGVLVGGAVLLVRIFRFALPLAALRPQIR